ncbi:hypothetical protein sce5994 [Sorangium cellulosum So ce56]|uniref:Secreted protein n=1 Tax=Sorangium cellulosum (strain So ce56) TaxID=448385 RepID=A9GC96_SORC5|nr:hypothetical protein sce5994 [Sorangium cellulosum So ce56]
MNCSTRGALLLLFARLALTADRDFPVSVGISPSRRCPVPLAVSFRARGVRGDPHERRRAHHGGTDLTCSDFANLVRPGVLPRPSRPCRALRLPDSLAGTTSPASDDGDVNSAYRLADPGSSDGLAGTVVADHADAIGHHDRWELRAAAGAGEVAWSRFERGLSAAGRGSGMSSSSSSTGLSPTSCSTSSTAPRVPGKCSAGTIATATRRTRGGPKLALASRSNSRFPDGRQRQPAPGHRRIPL